MMTNSKMSSIFTIYKWNEIGRITKLGIFMFILIGAGACSQDRKKSDNKLPQSAQQSIRAGKTDGKVKVKKAGGETAFILKFYDDGLKLLDQRENEIARITRTKSEKYRIKDAGDNVLGYVTGSSNKFKIVDKTQQLTLFIFQSQSDGDWKLESLDDEENLLWKVGNRDYGWKIESSTETKLSKVKVKNGRTTITDNNDDTTFYTNDEYSSLAIVPFTFNQLTKPQQAALSAALNFDFTN